MKSEHHRLFWLILVSCLQPYLCYLSHSYRLTFAPLDWIMTIISTPVYFLLLPVVYILDSAFNWDLTIYHNFIFPHLKLEAWVIGIIFLVPLNILYYRLYKKLLLLLSKKT